MIYNVPNAKGSNSTQHITVNMRSVMSVFLSQLKLLLGVLPVVRISTFYSQWTFLYQVKTRAEGLPSLLASCGHMWARVFL